MPWLMQKSMTLDATTWLDETWRRALAPEQALLVSQWADAHRILPPTSAEPGLWRTDRVPYLREMMDVLSTGSPYERIVLMKGAQAGGTEVGLNWLAYLVAHAPGIALLVMPSLDMARRNTRTRIDPMIDSTPILRELISAPRARDATNTVFAKSFPGGQLVCTAPTARRRCARRRAGISSSTKLMLIRPTSTRRAIPSLWRSRAT